MGVFNNNIPYYKVVPTQQLAQPTVVEQPYIDDIFDPIFNAKVLEAMSKKYPNPVVRTMAGYSEMLDNTFIDSTKKWGALGSGLGVLSTFGRSMDKADDFILGGLTEGVKGITGQGVQNPFTNIFENDEDYSGKRLIASMANGMSQIAHQDVNMTEDDFKGLWNLPSTALDLATDPGILGGTVAKRLAPTAKDLTSSQILQQLGNAGGKSAVGEVGQLLSNYDDFMAKVAGNATLPGILPLAKKLVPKIQQLMGVQTTDVFENIDLNTPEGVQKFTFIVDRLKNNPNTATLLKMNNDIDSAIEQAVAKENEITKALATLETAAPETVQQIPTEKLTDAITEPLETVNKVEVPKKEIPDAYQYTEPKATSDAKLDFDDSLLDIPIRESAIDEDVVTPDLADAIVDSLEKELGTNIFSMSDEDIKSIKDTLVASGYNTAAVNKAFTKIDLKNLRRYKGRVQQISNLLGLDAPTQTMLVKSIDARSKALQSTLDAELKTYNDGVIKAVGDVHSKMPSSPIKSPDDFAKDIKNVEDYFNASKLTSIHAPVDGWSLNSVRSALSNTENSFKAQKAKLKEDLKNAMTYSLGDELVGSADKMETISTRLADEMDDVTGKLSAFEKNIDTIFDKIDKFEDASHEIRRLKILTWDFFQKDSFKNLTGSITDTSKLNNYIDNLVKLNEDTKVLASKKDALISVIAEIDEINYYKEIMREALKDNPDLNYGNTVSELEDLLTIKPPEQYTKEDVHKFYKAISTDEYVSHSSSNQRIVDLLHKAINNPKGMFELKPSIRHSPKLVQSMVDASQSYLEQFYVTAKTLGFVPDDVKDAPALLKYIENLDAFKKLSKEPNPRLTKGWDVLFPTKVKNKLRTSDKYVDDLKTFVDDIYKRLGIDSTEETLSLTEYAVKTGIDGSYKGDISKGAARIAADNESTNLLLQWDKLSDEELLKILRKKSSKIVGKGAAGDALILEYGRNAIADAKSRKLIDMLGDLAKNLNTKVLSAMSSYSSNVAYSGSLALNKLIAENSDKFKSLDDIKKFTDSLGNYFEIVPKSIPKSMYQKQLDAVPNVSKQILSQISNKSDYAAGNVWRAKFNLPYRDGYFSLTGKVKGTLSLKKEEPFLYSLINRGIVNQDQGIKLFGDGTFNGFLDEKRILGSDSIQRTTPQFMTLKNIKEDAINSLYATEDYGAPKIINEFLDTYRINDNLSFSNYLMDATSDFKSNKMYNAVEYRKAIHDKLKADLIEFKKYKSASLKEHYKDPLDMTEIEKRALESSVPAFDEYAFNAAATALWNSVLKNMPDKAPEGMIPEASLDYYFKRTLNTYTQHYELPNYDHVKSVNEFLTGESSKKTIKSIKSTVPVEKVPNPEMQTALDDVSTRTEIAEAHIASIAEPEKLAEAVYAPETPAQTVIENLKTEIVPEIKDPGIPGNTPADKLKFASPKKRTLYKLISDASAIKETNKDGKYATVRIKRFRDIINDCRVFKLKSRLKDKEMRTLFATIDSANGDVIKGSEFITEMLEARCVMMPTNVDDAARIAKILTNNVKSINDTIGGELFRVVHDKLKDGSYRVGCVLNTEDHAMLLKRLNARAHLLSKLNLEDVVFEAPTDGSELAILLKDSKFSKAFDLIKKIQSVSDDFSTLVGLKKGTYANYYKHTMVEDLNAAEWLKNEVYAGIDLDDVTGFGEALCMLPAFDGVTHGSLRTVQQARRLRGNINRYSTKDFDVFSNDIEAIARNTLTGGYMNNVDLQCHVDLYLNDNYKINTYASTVDDLKRILYAKKPDGSESGNLANLILIAPKTDDMGKLVGYTKFDKLSDIGLQKALDNKDTILVPFGVAEHLDRVCKKSAKMSNKVYAFINKHLIVPFKFGVLANPGFLLNNISDASFKQIVTMSQKYGTSIPNEIANLSDSVREVMHINNKFGDIYENTIEALKKQGFTFKPEDLAPSSIVGSKKIRNMMLSYMDDLLTIGGEKVLCTLTSSECDTVRLFMFLNGLQPTISDNNIQDLGDLVSSTSKYNTATNPMSRFLSGSGAYNKHKPETWGVFVNNPVSNGFMNGSEIVERYVRSAAILNDLKHAGYDSQTIARTLDIPEMIDPQAYLNFRVKVTEALNAMNASNFNYDSLGTLIDPASYAIPFPTFYMKNIAYWLDAILKNPEIVDAAIGIQNGLWDDEDTDNDSFKAEAKGRGAIPFGRKTSNFKGILKPTPLNSLFSSMHTMQNPVEDTLQRLHPLLGGAIDLATADVGANGLLNAVGKPREEIKYRPYNDNVYQKNVTVDDPNFSPLKYLFHKLNPYDRAMKTFPRTVQKVKQGNAQPADFLPSIIQPDYGKK